MSQLSTAQTIPDLLRDQAALGEHLALIDGEIRLNYAQLHDSVRATARAYLANGISRGDRVAVWAPNSAAFVLSMLGAQYIGAAVVPLNTRYTGHEAAAILERSRASAVVLSDGFLGKSFSLMLRDATSPDIDDAVELPHLGLVINATSERADDCVSWDAFIASGSTVSEQTLDEAAAAVSPDDIIDILFTSGTTGLPKGVMSAQRQTLGVARAWAQGSELTSEDRYAIVNPFFHGFGYKAGMTTSLIAGATIYPLAVFDASELLALVERERITVLPGVPTIFTTLIDHPQLGNHDLSSLRFAIAGATAAPDSLFHDMVNKLSFSRVAQAYGLTEAVVVTMSRQGEDLDHASQTTGPAVAETEIRIVDDAGNAVPTGTDGEIWIRGANVMLGYFEDPEATAQAIDADGWFHTGDVGRLDEHGCLKITDRIKDMFIVGGFNVYPAEVENVLRKHPAVNESAVVGVPDERLGSVGRAYVALLSDVSPAPTPDELRDFCKARLANFKVPRDIEIVADFPRNATGKIQKSELATPQPH